MKMKKITAMSMAALMAATMIPSVPVMADGGGKVYYLKKLGIIRFEWKQ